MYKEYICDICILHNKIYKKKICLNCKNILSISNNWYFMNDKVYCSKKCRNEKNKKLNIHNNIN